MQYIKALFARYFLKNTFVLVVVVTAIGDAANYRAAMLNNDYTRANVIVSVIVFAAWCIFFYINSFCGPMSKTKMIRVNFYLLFMALLIILAYAFNKFDAFYSVAAAMITIPSYLIMIPLIGIEMPLWKLIERDLVCFSFLPFFVCIVFLALLLVLNVMFYYFSYKSSVRKTVNHNACCFEERVYVECINSRR